MLYNQKRQNRIIKTSIWKKAEQMRKTEQRRDGNDRKQIPKHFTWTHAYNYIKCKCCKCLQLKDKFFKIRVFKMNKHSTKSYQ